MIRCLPKPAFLCSYLWSPKLAFVEGWLIGLFSCHDSSLMPSVEGSSVWNLRGLFLGARNGLLRGGSRLYLLLLRVSFYRPIKDVVILEPLPNEETAEDL